MKTIYAEAQPGKVVLKEKEDADPAQIDALEGVTITAKGSVAGEYSLASGGKLIVTV